MEVLILRFDAPLMSFGAAVVDELGVIQDHPPLSMITGLIANALGYDHGGTERLARLQQRLRFACRRDRAGRRVRDFQTADIQQSFLREGWTTRRAPEGRAGAPGTQTHIRYRDFHADAVYTVALALLEPEEVPTLSNVATALRRPERPLFLGRKSCLPAAPILAGRADVPTLLAALQRHAPSPRADRTDYTMEAWWPSEDGASGAESRVHDIRDWANQVHVGSRLIRQGEIHLEREDANA